MDTRLADELWDETPDAIVATTPDDRVLYWNRAAEGIFGYPREQALDHTLDSLISPSDRLDEQARSAAPPVDSEPVIYETVRRRNDGSLVQVSVSTKYVRDADGNLRCLLSIYKDVSRLKLSRDSKLAESKFRDLLESLPDAVVLVNICGGIVLVNSRTERLFGFERAALIGTPLAMLLPSRMRARNNAELRNFFSDPQPHTLGLGCDLHGLRNDGEEFPVEISLSPVLTEEGTMLMCTVRDIADRRRVEQRFRGLLESAPDGLVIVGRDGRITLVNSRLERLFGYQRSELLGESVDMLVPPRFRERHSAHRSTFFTQSRARNMGEGRQLYGLRKDGSEFPVEISLSPIETDDGVFALSAIRDASERMRNEKALLEANRLKSEFLANMSHELRTPLNGIIGFSEFLIDEQPGPLNTKQKEYLRDVLSSGRHLLQIINDVLDLSKVEAGKMELHAEEFSLVQAIDEVSSVLSPLAQNKGVAVHCDVAPELTMVTLDRHKFMQILYNLLSNGIKFNIEGGRIQITARGGVADGLTLCVEDSGMGIDPKDFSKLFVEFEQLDSGAGRKVGGTGLGLALTKKIIEFQGGQVSVESQPGVGSRFIVHLPLLAGASPQHALRIA